MKLTIKGFWTADKNEKIDPEDYEIPEERERDGFSEDYPLGGMAEPYDIEREKEIIRDKEQGK